MSEDITRQMSAMPKRRAAASWDAAGQELLGFVRHTATWVVVAFIAGELPIGWLAWSAAGAFIFALACYFISVGFAKAAREIEGGNRGA